MDSVGGAGAGVFGQSLQLFLDLGNGLRVEEFAQVGVTEQVAELLLVDGERLCAALGERGISVINVVGDVTEEQRRGEGRGVFESTTWTRSWRLEMARRISRKAGMSKTSRMHSR